MIQHRKPAFKDTRLASYDSRNTCYSLLVFQNQEQSGMSECMNGWRYQDCLGLCLGPRLVGCISFLVLIFRDAYQIATNLVA